MTIQDIKNKQLLLFECVSGSKAYGLDTPQSDTDIKGVFYLPKDHFFGLQYIPQINNDSNDEVYYELGRFVELLLKNNPNILEILASPDACIKYKHPIMDNLRIEMFLSKLCKDTFAGYASTQIKKARGYKKKIVNPIEEERKDVLDFCYILSGYQTITLREWLRHKGYSQEQCGLSSIPHAKDMFALFYDKDNTMKYKGIANPEANEVSLSSIAMGAQSEAYLFWNKDGYSAYCKEYREYWDWVKNRNESRYRNNMDHGKNYDSKNMMHTIRLLQVAVEILRDGTLNVYRSNRDELLNIKSGKEDYDQLILMAEKLMEQIETYSLTCKLPETPNAQDTENVLVKMRKELYG